MDVLFAEWEWMGVSRASVAVLRYPFPSTGVAGAASEFQSIVCPSQSADNLSYSEIRDSDFEIIYTELES